MTLFKWLNSAGAWCVGTKVTGWPVPGHIRAPVGGHLLMQHYHTGKLEFVFEGSLTDYPSRSERGEEPYGSDTVKTEPVGS